MRLLATGTLIALGLCFAQPAAAHDAAETFAKKCANCHGKDGKGKTKMGEKLKIKDLTTGTWTEEDGLKAMNEGVKDKDTGKERMPAYKGKLSDAEIKDLVKHSKSLK